jgi:V/A-type H+-transporting ATPase subunit D
MAEIKLTKSELRSQQQRLGQLEKYLPTLQLKKAMLQAEVNEARLEIVQLETAFHRLYEAIQSYSALLSETVEFDASKAAVIIEVKKRYENIAGIDVPYLDTVVFQPVTYSLFDTPPWVDSVVVGLRDAAEGAARIAISREKKQALEKELRNVSIRVNLFEKILIPRALKNIKKIKVFLGDQQLAAVSQAKVAKTKIEERKKHAAQESQEAIHAV